MENKYFEQKTFRLNDRLREKGKYQPIILTIRH